jgi:hypothetical protein
MVPYQRTAPNRLKGGAATPLPFLRHWRCVTLSMCCARPCALILVAQMYACPCDLLAARLDTTEHTIRGMMVRWRRAGLAGSGSLSVGPA